MKDVDLESGLLEAAGLPPSQAFAASPDEVARRRMYQQQQRLAQMQARLTTPRYVAYEMERAAYMQSQENYATCERALAELLIQQAMQPDPNAVDVMAQIYRSGSSGYGVSPDRDALEAMESRHAAEMARAQAELDRLRALVMQPQSEAQPARLPSPLPVVELDEGTDPAFARDRLKQVEGQIVED